MTKPPAARSIEELRLDDSEELKLYLELIRVIEKDIDEVKAGDTRNGWTTWAIIGGIAGALLLLFGETRKLTSFPTEQVETIGLAGSLLYLTVITLSKLFYYDNLNIRPGRIRWSNEAYFSFVPSAVYSLLTLIFSIFIAIVLPLPLLTKVIIIAALALWTLLTLLLLILSKIPFPFGNNRLSKKSGLGISVVSALLSLVGLVLLGTRIHFPIGEAATLPFILAGLILVIVLLLGHLIFRTAPSRLLSNLQDLRNDIIFLRVEIDEALRRYETLSEGETLPDALKKELSEIVDDLNLIEYTHSNMSSLIEKMIREIPSPGDSEQTKEQKSKQYVLDRDSYSLHDLKCTEILTSLQGKLTVLTKNLGRLSAVTEDLASANTIRSLLNQRLQGIEAVQAQLKQQFQQAIYFASNPDKIPQELRTSTEETAEAAQSGSKPSENDHA